MSALPAVFDGVRRVLAVQPHYDDNDIAAGGTLAALADHGAEIHYLTVTDDLVGVLDTTLTDAAATAQLRSEQTEAGEVIGVTSQHWLGYPDAGDYDAFELRGRIIEQVRRLQPDLLMTTDPRLPDEAHPDHLRTGNAVAEALLLHRFPRLPTEPDVDEAYFRQAEGHRVRGLALYFTVEPSVLMDIDATRDRKHRAIDAYRAQFRPEELEGLHALLARKEREFAQGHSFEYGEPIRFLQPAQLHCHVDRLRT